MVLIDNIFSALVAFGTIFLATVTYLSIRESRRREAKTDRLTMLSEKIQLFYVPMLTELFETREGKSDINSVYRIAYLNYILAEERTRRAIDTMVSHFGKIDTKKPAETQTMIKADYLALEDAIKSDYEKLIREFYDQRGLIIPESFKIPDIVDGGKRP